MECDVLSLKFPFDSRRSSSFLSILPRRMTMSSRRSWNNVWMTIWIFTKINSLFLVCLQHIFWWFSDFFSKVPFGIHLSLNQRSVTELTALQSIFSIIYLISRLIRVRSLLCRCSTSSGFGITFTSGLLSCLLQSCSSTWLAEASGRGISSFPCGLSVIPETWAIKSLEFVSE